MSGGTTSREHFASGDTTLRRPELHPVCQTGHDRLPSGSPITRVRLALLDETQREALADLLDLDRLPDPQPPPSPRLAWRRPSPSSPTAPYEKSSPNSSARSATEPVNAAARRTNAPVCWPGWLVTTRYGRSRCSPTGLRPAEPRDWWRLGGTYPYAPHRHAHGARRTTEPGRTPARLRRPTPERPRPRSRRRRTRLHPRPSCPGDSVRHRTAAVGSGTTRPVVPRRRRRRRAVRHRHRRRTAPCAYSRTEVQLSATTVTSTAKVSALPRTSSRKQGRTPGA